MLTHFESICLQKISLKHQTSLIALSNQRSHTTPYHCQYCEKKYASKPNLQLHEEKCGKPQTKVRGVKEILGFWNPKQKDFFIPVRDSWWPHKKSKNAKMAHFNRWMKFDFFGPNVFIWSAMKVSFCDFVQNLSQTPSQVDKWDYFKNHSQELKISFCLGFL